MQIIYNHLGGLWIAFIVVLNGVASMDNDIDVQMPIQDLLIVLHGVQSEHDQKTLVESLTSVRYGRYFLDCGTFISHRTAGNGTIILMLTIDVDTGFLH